MPDLVRGDRVVHATFGEGVVEAVRGDVATVKFLQGKPRTILASHLTRHAREGLPERAADAVTMFDAYLMVDWSANGKPKTGADSVWYCLFEPIDSRLLTVNPSTRQQAFAEIRSELLELVARKRRVLVGFDFPYGLPRGTADLLGFSGGPYWRILWEELSALVEDGPDNTNNRFSAAADLNGAMTTGPAPFWGGPAAGCGEFLHSTKPKPWPSHIPELRITDRAITSPKSTWQLFGAGSVGSQTLLGIPRLTALRDEPELSAISQVWPFETGGLAPGVPAQGTAFVLHAEIYPSLVPPSTDEEVKDAAQVRGVAEHMARLDDDGKLASLFDLTALPPDAFQAVIGEEGWILGVEPEAEAAS